MDFVYWFLIIINITGSFTSSSFFSSYTFGLSLNMATCSEPSLSVTYVKLINNYKRDFPKQLVHNYKCLSATGQKRFRFTELQYNVL